MRPALCALLPLLILDPSPVLSAQRSIIGIYVHQHWPYKHPYAARTWSLKDWDLFSSDLQRIGYNTVMIWPVLETIPDPPTPSDVASLKKHSSVIEMLHRKGMRAWIVLCPNIVPKDAEASEAPFESRFFFHSDKRVNPANPQEMADMMRRRKSLMRYLRKADAVCIIDSDPGGYPGSTNEEFVRLLGNHRKMLDELRPGIELVYWMHAGWEAYSKHYATGAWFRGTDEEHLDALRRLIKLNPELWGVANGLKYAEQLGIRNRVVAFNYGKIEREPSFPMTMFTPQEAWAAGKDAGPRGVMGNAQTHCVQLPNLYAFGRGASGKSIEESDLVEFAEDLVHGGGEQIARAWRVLGGDDNQARRTALSDIEALLRGKIKTGRYKGLLFSNPERFLQDLAMMLKLRIQGQEFIESPDRTRLAAFIQAAEAWQKQHGYQNRWAWNPLFEALRKLNDSGINAALEPKETGEGYARVSAHLAAREIETTRVLNAIKDFLKRSGI